MSEMLAVVYFTKYYKYLLGRNFTLRTNHGSLKWIKKFKEPDGQIHRWVQQFHVKIVDRVGSRHGNADALSRLVNPSSVVCKQCDMPWDYEYQGLSNTEIKYTKEEENVINVTVENITDDISTEEMRNDNLDDLNRNS